MDDEKFESRLDRIEKRLEEGFTQIHGLIDALASTCVREFASINERFARVDSRLEAIEGKIETFARRVDDEVESRHALGDRVSKLEKTL
jgi:tetrahydromethanopterin S-methyltransferase subunit G